jgi:hypothetical protein
VKELLLNTHEELSTSLLEETLDEQWSDEQKKFVSSNNSYHLHSSFVFKNQTTGGTTTMNKVMAKITDLMKQFKELEGMGGTGSSFQCTMIHGGGKARTKKTSDTAFPWRQGDYFGYILVEWIEKRLHYKETVKDFLQKMQTCPRPSLRRQKRLIYQLHRPKPRRGRVGSRILRPKLRKASKTQRTVGPGRNLPIPAKHQTHLHLRR